MLINKKRVKGEITTSIKILKIITVKFNSVVGTKNQIVVLKFSINLVFRKINKPTQGGIVAISLSDCFVSP
jgi:hypothetical protein